MGRNGLLVAWIVTLVHACQGVTLIIWPHIREVTSLDMMSSVIGRWQLGIIVLLAAAAVGVAHKLDVKRRDSLWFWGLVLPQQALLTVSAIAAIIAIVSGAYPNGHVPEASPEGLPTVDSSIFIFRDQVWVVAIAVAHAIAAVRHSVDHQRAHELLNTREDLRESLRGLD